MEDVVYAEEIKRNKELGAKSTWPGQRDYPKFCKEICDPPKFLSYFGTPCWNTHALLSVVGSREAQPQTLRWMDEHMDEMAATDQVAFVSGAARGIDQKAHEISLRNFAPTIAFIPAGLAKIYPSDFQKWMAPIVDNGGAVISEFLADTPMYKGHFQKRNRLIAAISPVTFVVEARRKSGSLMTARLAGDYHRTIATLPGFPGDAKYAGNNDLLYDGAQMIRDAWDLQLLVEKENHRLGLGAFRAPQSEAGKNKV